MSTKKPKTYEYGKGNTFVRKDGSVGEVTKLPPNVPEPGTILFYKKRAWKKRRLNEMNQWKFVCIETQGQEKGKWKVQGLHKEEGDYNWFDPHSLMRSCEVTNDLFREPPPSVKEDKKVKQNKKPISVDKPECDVKIKIRELLAEDEKIMQKDIAEEIGITRSAVSQHIKQIRLADQKKNGMPHEVGDYPIFSYKETSDYLGIGLKMLNRLIRENSIRPIVKDNNYKFTESQVERLTEIVNKEKGREKKVTPQELGTYGAEFPEKPKEDKSSQKEHKATVEMKNYNYKRVISENLKMIKSLIHQTEALLEKIQ